MFDTSTQLTGSMANMTIQTNLSDYIPTDWRNWSVPDDCTMVTLSKLDFLPGNNPDAIVSADIRRIVYQIRNSVFLLLFLIGTPANIINMVVFYKQGLKDRVTLCLFFLAFTDGMYLTLSTIFQAEELYMQFLSRRQVSPFLTFVINNRLLAVIGIYYSSPILSAIIAVERCLCVFNPLKVQNLMRTRTMAAIIFVVYVSVYGFSYFLFLRYRIGCLYDPVYGIRVMASIEGEFYKANRDLINYMEAVVFSVGVVGGTMVVVTISTTLTIVKLGQIRQWRSESSSFSSRDIALTRMLVNSSILFIVCVSPYALFNVIRLIFPEVDYGESEHNLFVCCRHSGEIILLLKPCSNIVVYYTMGSRYRETFWTVLGRKKQQQIIPEKKRITNICS